MSVLISAPDFSPCASSRQEAGTPAGGMTALRKYCSSMPANWAEGASNTGCFAPMATRSTLLLSAAQMVRAGVLLCGVRNPPCGALAAGDDTRERRRERHRARGRLRTRCSTWNIGRLRRRRHAARRTRGRRRRRGLDCRLRLLLRGALSRSHAVREEQVEPEHAGEPDGDGDEQVLVLVLHASLFREDGGTGSGPPAAHGWQRSRRLSESQEPSTGPWARTASCAYCEQLG